MHRLPLRTQNPLTERLLALPRAVLVLITLMMVLWVAVGDTITGADVAFTLLYIGPVIFAVWTLGVRWGVAASVVSALASLGSTLLTRERSVPLTIDLWNLGTELGVFLFFTLLLGELRRRLREESDLARTDPLTGLANGRAFIDQLERELGRQRRVGGTLSLAYLDLDEFKAINDQFGHAEGDRVLQAMGAHLRAGTRSVDMAARLGGDEFAILLPEADEQNAFAAMERLRLDLNTSFRLEGWRVTASMGVSVLLGPFASANQALALADGLMREAKNRGKDRIVLRTVSGPAPIWTRMAPHAGSQSGSDSGNPDNAPMPPAGSFAGPSQGP
jgi:diguanylate cyclase (GGDEF)-like protein